MSFTTASTQPATTLQETYSSLRGRWLTLSLSQPATPLQLTYRGCSTYHYLPAAAKPTATPHAVNWRYRLPGQMSISAIAPRLSVLPRAINWRYQIA